MYIVYVFRYRVFSLNIIIVHVKRVRPNNNCNVIFFPCMLLPLTGNFNVPMNMAIMAMTFSINMCFRTEKAHHIFTYLT